MSTESESLLRASRFALQNCHQFLMTRVFGVVSGGTPFIVS